MLITRLRLLIAIIDAQCRGSGFVRPSDVKPLPNLETRCVAANTLCVNLSGQSVFGTDEVNKATEELRAAREMWTVAYYPEDKQFALQEESSARARLRRACKEWGLQGDPEWLEWDFLSSVKPASFDVRNLFPSPEKGWDIVLGNPPYQKPSKEDRRRGKALGYEGHKENLYLMFVEAALRVVRPNGGCLCLIMPHSIVFGRNKAFTAVRRKLEAGAKTIGIRTFDNRPQPVFPRLPWLEKKKENRQRITLVTALLNSGSPESQRAVVHSAGLIRLTAGDRKALRRSSATPGCDQAPWSIQWTQAPTRELAALLAAMRMDIQAKPRRLADSTETRVLTFPQTAFYFISCLPIGSIDNDGRQYWRLPDNAFFWPWTGLYNSHLFHAYWLMVSDAFHVTMQDIGTVRQPPGWDDPALLERTGQLARRLCSPEVLRDCHFVHRHSGKEFPNVNFHDENTNGPDIIRELDQILLDAYGLSHKPLMNQMRIIRKGSAHTLSMNKEQNEIG